MIQSSQVKLAQQLLIHLTKILFFAQQTWTYHRGPVWGGGSFSPPLSFKPFHIGISEGLHVAMGISFIATDTDIGNI